MKRKIDLMIKKSIFRKSTSTNSFKYHNKFLSTHNYSESLINNNTDRKQNANILNYLNTPFILNKKSLISITGKDAKSYLQGLTTNNINKLTQDSNYLNTVFLNNKGKTLFDCNVILVNKVDDPNSNILSNEEILLEIDSDKESELISHLKAFKIRKKVNVNLVRDKEIYTYLSNSIFANNSNTSNKINDDDNINESIKFLSDKGISYYEKRTDPLYLKRFIINKASYNDNIKSNSIKLINNDSEYIESKKDNILNDLEEYHDIFLQSNGIYSSQYYSNNFPYLCNYDLFNSIDYKKGCYLGQELTQRTHFTGVIRRRMFPFYLSVKSGKNNIYSNTINTSSDVRNHFANIISNRNHCLDSDIIEKLKLEENIFSEKEEKIGKLIMFNEQYLYGIGIFTVDKLTESSRISFLGNDITVVNLIKKCAH